MSYCYNYAKPVCKPIYIDTCKPKNDYCLNNSCNHKHDCCCNTSGCHEDKCKKYKEKAFNYAEEANKAKCRAEYLDQQIKELLEESKDAWYCYEKNIEGYNIYMHKAKECYEEINNCKPCHNCSCHKDYNCNCCKCHKC